MSRLETTRENLEALYRRFNKRALVHPDPLEFLYQYPEKNDREIVALVASSLAYGRVAQILKSVELVLQILGPVPSLYLSHISQKKLQSSLAGFRHRFCDEYHMARLLWAAKNMIKQYGSLEGAFARGTSPGRENVLPALSEFCDRLADAGFGAANHLAPHPCRGSACKRWHLFLRWMVRKDAVDPGGWTCVTPSMLIIPLDVHMHRVCARLGFTNRATPDAKCALEITRAFQEICPEDPVKYDFSLTRPGIWENYNKNENFSE